MDRADKKPHKISPLELLKYLLIGSFLYVAVTLYETDFGLVIYNNGVYRDLASELRAMWQCLAATHKFTFAFMISAFAYAAYEFQASLRPSVSSKASEGTENNPGGNAPSHQHLHWYDYTVAFLAVAGLIIGRIYNNLDTILDNDLDCILGLVVAADSLGLYFIACYLILFAKKFMAWLLGRPLPCPTDYFSYVLARWIDRFEANLFLYSWLAIILAWIPYNIFKFPAGLGHDAYYQIEEYFGILPLAYRYWPVASTLFMGSLVEIGQILTGSLTLGLFFMAVVHMLICSAMLAYTMPEARRFGIPVQWRCLMLLTYQFSPIFFSYQTSVIKDNLFSCLVVVFTFLLARLLFFNKSSNKDNCYMLCAIAFLCCIFRSNGMYITVFCLLAILIPNLRKQATYLKNNFHPICCALAAALVMFTVYNWGLARVINFPKDGIKEALSIPFQQTARYVRDHGREVTFEERQAIDAVLNYVLIPDAYCGVLSDFVKITYRKDNSKLPAYFVVWFKQFFKHPLVYVESLLANSSGFFYLDADTIWIYSSPRNHDQMNYEIPPVMAKLKAVALSFTECVWRLPFVNLFSDVAFSFYVVIYILFLTVKNKDLRIFWLLVPSLVGILVCIASPTFFNGGVRYAMPVAYSLPFIIGLCLCKAPEAEEEGTSFQSEGTPTALAQTKATPTGSAQLETRPTAPAQIDVHPETSPTSIQPLTSSTEAEPDYPLLVTLSILLLLTSILASAVILDKTTTDFSLRASDQKASVFKYVGGPQDFLTNPKCAIKLTAPKNATPTFYKIRNDSICEIGLLYNRNYYVYSATRDPNADLVDLDNWSYSTLVRKHDRVKLDPINPILKLFFKSASGKEVEAVFYKYDLKAKQVTWRANGIRYSIVFTKAKNQRQVPGSVKPYYPQLYRLIDLFDLAREAVKNDLE